MEAPYVCHSTKRQLVQGTDKNTVISTSSELVHKKRRKGGGEEEKEEESGIENKGTMMLNAPSTMKEDEQMNTHTHSHTPQLTKLKRSKRNS